MSAMFDISLRQNVNTRICQYTLISYLYKKNRSVRIVNKKATFTMRQFT